MNNFDLNKNNIESDLGVQIDSKLTFYKHIETVVSKTYKNLGLI